MNYSSLCDLITYLEYGTKLHIGVLFLGHYGSEQLAVPYKNTIHTSPICETLKTVPQGYRRCYRCRNAAIQKAIRTKEAFGGICINGIYEYTRPITIDNTVVCIIFIGNILPESGECAKIKQRLLSKKYLIETLEKNFGFEKCEAVGVLLESYIRMTLDSCHESSENKEFDPLMENLKNYIEANLEYKIDISLLAKMFHYNEKYLGRLFKKKMGMSFSEYVNRRRVEYGKTLLCQSDDTIINVAAKAGFHNVTYFNRMFQKYLHMTPTEYRLKRFRKQCKEPISGKQ